MASRASRVKNAWCEVTTTLGKAHRVEVTDSKTALERFLKTLGPSSS